MKPEILLVLWVLMLFSSCTVYREYSIEIYKPGEIVLNPDVKSAAVAYRNFKYPGDTLQNFFRKGNQLVNANDSQNIDSILVNACLNNLAISLKNHHIFEEVPVFPYHTFERHTGEHLSRLPEHLISQLTTDANAGILISLENLSTFFSTYPGTYDAPLTNEVVTIAVWGIYNGKNTERAERKIMIDTIFWNGYDAEGNIQQNYTPPPRLTALELASAMAGESFAEKFSATWETVKRMYSIPPLPDFSDAAFFFEEGKWNEAILLWQKYSDDRNGKMAINARYNLALAYEMKDDFESAQQWLAAALTLAQSYRSKKNIQTIQLYQKILNTRKKDFSILNRIENEITH